MLRKILAYGRFETLVTIIIIISCYFTKKENFIFFIILICILILLFLREYIAKKEWIKIQKNIEKIDTQIQDMLITIKKREEV